MLYLDDDMDELFRKAGENYPLKTEVKDWDTFASGLIQPSDQGTAVKTAKKKNSRKILPLLLLLFIALATIGTTNYFLYSKKNTSGLINETPEPGTNNLQNKKLKPTIFDQEKNYASPKKIIEKKYSLDFNSAEHITLEKSTAYLVFKKKDGLLIHQRGSNNEVSISKYEVNFPETETSNSSVDEQASGAAAKVLIISKQKNSLPVTDTIREFPEARVNKVKKYIQKSGLYFGVAAGPQLNQVKSQGFNKAGLSIGIFAGYRFNKNLSLETGIFYSEKYYFTDGKYFDMAKSGAMSTGMKVISLNGRSNIAELPVRVKYDFLKNRNSNWFFTSGISSYMLTNENNDYFVAINGSQQNMQANYGKKKGYFSAAVNLGVGYEFNVRKNMKARIEPYLQIPLRGIGVGSLQVMTTGIHIGLTKGLHK